MFGVFLRSVSRGSPCPLQDALISLAQAEPGRLPGAPRTVPKMTRGEPVLALQGDLQRNSTRTQGAGLHLEQTGSFVASCSQLGQHTVNMLQQQKCKKPANLKGNIGQPEKSVLR